MNIQKSYKENKATGILYLVGTPIGNLDDITFRAIKALKEVDLIAAEDTRRTIKLLNHYEIQKKLISYHEHNKEDRGKELLKKLEDGTNIAVVSDAGMPAISDPGYELVRDAIEYGITVIPIPGANAAISGLVASGLPTQNFVFTGFLPREKKELNTKLEQLCEYQETLICYEAPHRIKKTLIAINKVLGNREIVLIRELTKKHEEFIRGTVEEFVEYIETNPLKGEITLIIKGTNESEIKYENEAWWLPLSIINHVDHYISQGYSSKEAIKSVSVDRGMSKREVYQEYHVLNKNL